MYRRPGGTGFGGSSKATASTVCQKCLKKDESLEMSDVDLADSILRHYSYECKASTTERPYVSRPSRTQQLLNPKLVPQLTSDVPNDLLQKKGIADEQLAKNKSERGRALQAEDETGDDRRFSRKRSRSVSSYPSDSVSTVSTNRSRSLSLKRTKYDDGDECITSQRDPMSLPQHRDMDKKRRRRSSSSLSYLSESSHERRSRSRDDGRNTRRRRGVMSPDERGRRRSSKEWKGSARHRSRSRSMNRSQIARHRLSMEPGHLDQVYPRGRERGSYQANQPPLSEIRQRYENGFENHHAGKLEQPPRKERSLSPFSKRLALTQAMNMGR